MSEPLPPFADVDDLAARLPGGIEAADEARAEAALVDASRAIRAEAGITWVDEDTNELLDDVPEIIATICMAAARRAFLNPHGIRSEQLDQFSTSFGNPTGDVYLTKGERASVRTAAGRSPVSTIQLTRPETPFGVDQTIFVTDQIPGSDPIPYDYERPTS